MKQGDKSPLGERGRLYFENMAKALEERPMPHKDHKDTAEDRTEPDLKGKGKEHLIEDDDVWENAVHTEYMALLKLLKECEHTSSAVKSEKDSYSIDTKQDLVPNAETRQGNDEKEEIPPSGLRNNVVGKRSRMSEIERCRASEPRYEDERVKTKKQMVLDTIVEISTDEDEGEILKCSGKDCDSRNVIIEISSDEDEGSDIK